MQVGSLSSSLPSDHISFKGSSLSSLSSSTSFTKRFFLLALGNPLNFPHFFSIFLDAFFIFLFFRRFVPTQPAFTNTHTNSSSPYPTRLPHHFGLKTHIFHIHTTTIHIFNISLQFTVSLLLFIVVF
ncbi:hypothetical protein I3843_10G128100 [Carya illinoinensis]|nr:hypothetical protein I3843_10G128100 [Carya illinoinensis]